MITGYEKKIEILEEFKNEINGKYPIIINNTKLISSEIMEKVFQISVEEQMKVIKSEEMLRAKTIKELHDCYDLFLLNRADAIWTINDKQWKSMSDKNYKFQITNLEDRRIECKCWECDKHFCEFNHFMNYFYKTMTPSKTKRVNKNFFTYNGFKILVRTFYNKDTKESLDFREMLIKFVGDIYFNNKLDNQGKISTDKITVKDYFQEFNMEFTKRGCNRNITLYASMAYNHLPTDSNQKIKEKSLETKKTIPVETPKEEKKILNLYGLLKNCIEKLKQHQRLLKDAQSMINKQNDLIDTLQNQVNKLQFC